MWLAKIALQRPYSFVVLALLILLLGVFTTLRIPIDIFPNINIPVVAAIWSYTGLSPDDMAKRIVLLTEKAAQTDISNVEHTESQSLNGIAVTKYFFFPGAYAQVHFKVPQGTESLSVPASAVLFRSADLQVAVVGADHRVTLKSITTGRDFGTSLEVLTGLSAGEDIVANPPDSLATGTLVHLIQPQDNPTPTISPTRQTTSARIGKS
jgi:AcrB/AcrD/AcrF family